jgi:hypothetical protein
VTAAHGRRIDEGQDALIGIDEDVAEGGKDGVEVGWERERRGDEVVVGPLVGGEGGVGEVERGGVAGGKWGGGE